MLRVVSLLVFVSACASSAPNQKTMPSVPDARRAPLVAVSPVADHAERASRLAPPFGPSAGVRRVSKPSVADTRTVAAPDVLAAVER